MRRFFQLRDDMTILGRWHLGEIRTPSGYEPLLDAGLPYTGTEDLHAEITTPGRVLEFCLTSFAVPVGSSGLARAVKAIASSDLQCVPITIAAQTGMSVLNAVRVLPCLDEARSEVIKWTTRDHRADLAGQYRQVTKLAIDASRVPSDPHFFRIEGWLIALIVSVEVKCAMENEGCLGAKFTAV